MPTEEQWERAARGADGRFFPWGNGFDWTFCKGDRSRSGSSQPEPAGLFPADESPFGVRDLGGSAFEWCADWLDGRKEYRALRGGAWCSANVFYFRAATRLGVDPKGADGTVGFRVVCVARVPQ